MHPAPSMEIIERFVGDTLGQVCLDPYGVQLRFETEANLSVYHWIEHVEPDGTRHSYNCIAGTGPALLLHRLLKKTVVKVERDDLYFEIIFDNGSVIKVYSELGQYESGTISGGRFNCCVVF